MKTAMTMMTSFMYLEVRGWSVRSEGSREFSYAVGVKGCR